MAEAGDLKSPQCRFESDRGHQSEKTYDTKYCANFCHIYDRFVICNIHIVADMVYFSKNTVVDLEFHKNL